MACIDRRAFLQASAATLGAAALRPTPAVAEPPKAWRKAWMLGGLRKGPVKPTFELLKQAGFEGVEMISPSTLDRDEVIKARDETGITIHGVSGGRHWQDTLSDPDPAVVERGLAAIRLEIEECKAFGGSTVLVVPAVVTPKVSYRDAYTRSQRAIRTLIPLAEKHGIYLAIEEVWNKFLLSPVEFSKYIDEFESPWVCAYFDVGNVVEFGYPQEWIRELGKRIKKIHIKEYSKAKRFAPKLGEGEIAWDEVRSALKEIGYEGWITAEVGFGDLDYLKDVSKRMDDLLGMG